MVNRPSLGAGARRATRLGGRAIRTAFGPRIKWVTPDVAEIGGQRFLIAWNPQMWEQAPPSTAEQFVLMKRPEMVEDYLRRFRRDLPRNIVEVGVYEGGSAAMLWQMCRPRRLVGIELVPAPSDAVDRFVEQRGADGLRVHWETDQADIPRVLEIVDQELGDEPIDFVLDDGSHLYAQTRHSFEALFPCVRPGGTYLIEDWGWAHWQGSPWQDPDGPFGDEPAMSNLIFELVMLAATRPDIVSRVDVCFHHVEVVRGPAVLDAPIVLRNLYEARGVEFKPVV